MQLSEISLYEYVTINATWHYVNHERQFNCKKQLVKYQKHSEAQVEDFLNKNGCQDRIIKTVRHSVNNINFYSCICNFNNTFMSFYLEMHELYKKGIMPYQGGLDQQPAYLLEIFNVIDSLYFERNKELAKAHEKSIQKSGK